MPAIDVAEKLSLFCEHGSPKVVARLDDEGERTAAYDDSLLEA